VQQRRKFLRGNKSRLIALNQERTIKLLKRFRVARYKISPLRRDRANTRDAGKVDCALLITLNALSQKVRVLCNLEGRLGIGTQLSGFDPLPTSCLLTGRRAIISVTPYRAEDPLTVRALAAQNRGSKFGAAHCGWPFCLLLMGYAKQRELKLTRIPLLKNLRDKHVE
jgi:hypothetical protein